MEPRWKFLVGSIPMTRSWSTRRIPWKTDRKSTSKPASGRRTTIVRLVKRSHFFLSCAASLFFLAGCTVGPNYHRPDVATAPAWKEQPPWRAAEPKDSIPKGNWWSTFADSELDQYETQALKSNQTIEVARFQLEQARASARITRSGLFPQLTTGISAQRSQTSAWQADLDWHSAHQSLPVQ